MLGGATKQSGGNEAGGFLASKFAQNMICVFILYCWTTDHLTLDTMQ